MILGGDMILDGVLVIPTPKWYLKALNSYMNYNNYL